MSMKKRICSLLLCVVLLVSAVTATTIPVSATSKMTASDGCIAMIKSFEGFCKYPFWDHGQFTVGYGSRCPDADYDRYMANGITEEEADALLREYVTIVEDAVNWFANKNGLTFTQAQFDALVDFTYNCGSGWMTGNYKFRSAVINGTTGNEFVELIASWCTASGTVYSGLLRRRLCEANLYLNGVYDTSASSYYSYVLYNAHGGSLSATGYQIFPAGTTADFRLSAARSGYDFLGWYTSSSNGTQVTALDSSLDGSTLHAYWKTLNGETEDNAEPDYEITEVTYQRIVSVSNYLNTREKPDSSSKATGYLTNGTVVTIVAETTVNDVTWGKLSEGDWICLKYTTECTAEDDEENEETDSAISVMATTVLNVRSGAGTSYEKTGKLYSGQMATITEVTTDSNGSPWGKLSGGGWICLTYTTYNQEQDDTTENIPEDKNVTVKVTSGPLNVRSGAGTSYAVQKILTIGKSVTIVETQTVSNTLWGELSDGGWICLTYTDYSAASTGGSTGSTGGGTSTATSVMVNVTNGPLNVRGGAGTSYAVQKTLSTGAVATIVSTKTVSGTVWGELSSGGWICLTYTDYTASGSSSTGGTGSTSGAAVTGTVGTSGGLNIRASASTSAAIVGSYTYGMTVEILEQTTVNGVAWGRTSYGWICMSYVKTSGGANTSATYTVTGDVVNVRSGADTSYAVVKTMTRGTSVTIVATQTDSNGMTWGQLSGVGWISMSYVA